MRKEEYRIAEGDYRPGRNHAVLVKPADLCDAWLKMQSWGKFPADYESSVKYVVASAQHETNFALNERDTEADGFVSMGLFQISDEEIKRIASASLPRFRKRDSIIYVHRHQSMVDKWFGVFPRTSGLILRWRITRGSAPR
jgi:hypothetical protein